MQDLHNNDLQDIRKSTMQDTQPNNILCEIKIKNAVSAAINKVFPQEIAEIKNIIKQYDKVVKSNVMTRFEYFDFENLDKKMTMIEEIDESIREIAIATKNLTKNMMFEKDEMKKNIKIWIKQINEIGKFNVDKAEVVNKGINNIKEKMHEIENNKNSFFNLTNIIVLVLIGMTIYNSYQMHTIQKVLY